MKSIKQEFSNCISVIAVVLSLAALVGTVSLYWFGGRATGALRHEVQAARLHLEALRARLEVDEIRRRYGIPEAAAVRREEGLDEAEERVMSREEFDQALDQLKQVEFTADQGKP